VNLIPHIPDAAFSDLLGKAWTRASNRSFAAVPSRRTGELESIGSASAAELVSFYVGSAVRPLQTADGLTQPSRKISEARGAELVSLASKPKWRRSAFDDSSQTGGEQSDQDPADQQMKPEIHSEGLAPLKEASIGNLRDARTEAVKPDSGQCLCTRR
jgi:hypothetical protein